MVKSLRSTSKRNEKSISSTISSQRRARRLRRDNASAEALADCSSVLVSCETAGEALFCSAASWTRALSQSCGMSASVGTCCKSLRTSANSLSAWSISFSSDGKRRPQFVSDSTSLRHDLTWCCSAPTHQRNSLKLTSPCSWTSAFTMSSISEARRPSESNNAIHDERLSPGSTCNTWRHAAISSCNCLTVTTSVRCRKLPRAPASVSMALTVSVNPSITRESNRRVSGNSIQACLTAIKCPARLPLSTVEMYCGKSGSSVSVLYQLKK